MRPAKKKLPRIETASCNSTWTSVLICRKGLLDNNFFINRTVVQNSFQGIDTGSQTRSINGNCFCINRLVDHKLTGCIVDINFFNVIDSLNRHNIFYRIRENRYSICTEFLEANTANMDIIGFGHGV